MLLEFFLFLSIILNLAIGVFVFIKNPKQPANIFFFLFVLGLSGWTTSYLSPFIINIPYDIINVLIYVALFSALFIGVGFFFFSLFFPVNLKTINKIYISIGIIGIILFISILLIPDIFYSNLRYSFEEKSIGGDFGIGLLLLTGVTTFFALWGFINLITKYYQSNQINKKQISYILVAMIILLVFGVPSGVVLPFLGEFEYVKIGPISTLIAIIIMSFAILKYRLLDIKIVIRKSLVFGLTIICLLGIVILLAILTKDLLYDYFGIDPIISVIIIMALMILILPAMKDYIKEKLDNIFLKEYIDLSAKVDQLSQNLQSETQLMGLAEKACVNIQALLEVRNVRFFSINRQENKFILNYPEKKQILKMENPFIKYFQSSRDILIKQEIPMLLSRQDGLKDQLKKLQLEMQKTGSEAVIPLFAGKELIGMIFMGEKMSGKECESSDIESMKSIAENAELALENVLHYQEALKNIQIHQQM
ncbi:hypothetical protein KJ839_03020, partial [Patescibacteria group bacterium]|nr:hypothetical protein [Patescibacteria group bacterium]